MPVMPLPRRSTPSQIDEEEFAFLTVLETLGARGGELCVHEQHREQAPIVLARHSTSGTMYAGPSLTAGWASTRFDGDDVLTITFQDPDDAPLIVLTARFEAATMPDRKLIAAHVERYRPLLGATFRLWNRLRVEREQAALLSATLDEMAAPFIVLDGHGHISFANTAAAAVLKEARYLRRRQGALAAARLSDAMRVQSVLSAALASGAASESTAAVAAVAAVAPRLLRLEHDGDHVIVAVAPLRCGRHGHADGSALVMVLDPLVDSAPLIAPLCRVYGLSPVETKLTCLLVAGRCLQQACEIMHIKEQTARGYMKQIFAKTNVKRQVDLIRLLLTGIVRTHAPAI